jgi:allophanate hydrolase
LIGEAFSDQAMLALGEKFHRAVGGRLGGTEIELRTLSTAPLPAAIHPSGSIILAVAGAHLRGQPLHQQLMARDADFLRITRTSGDYRLFSLQGTEPPKPGLVRTPGLAGPGIEVELWSLDEAAFGSLVAEVPPPMAIGAVKLQDGAIVRGFLCETFAIDGSRDITVFGGWRSYLGSLCAVKGKPSADGTPHDSARTTA